LELWSLLRPDFSVQSEIAMKREDVLKVYAIPDK
jgi:hypothetical protein